MDELLTRTWDMLIGREHGFLHLRLILQPMMAALLAIRAGYADARAGRPAFGWAVIVGKGRRLALLRDGLKDVAGLFLAALAIDALYQIIVLHWIYPVQALIVATLVAVPTYLLIRGPVSRVARFWLGVN